MGWWNEEYLYRRRITLKTPPEPLPAGHIVKYKLPKVVEQNGKIRPDYEDVEVLMHLEQDEYLLFYREISEKDDGLEIVFQIPEDLESNVIIEDTFYVYYGNPNLVNTISRPEPVDTDEPIDPWPIGLPANSEGTTGYGYFTYTRPGEHWEEGVSSVRHARATVLLYATDFRVISKVDRNQAIFEIQVDNGPWDSVDLFSQETIEFKEVYSAHDLNPDILHEIRIRVSGKSNISSQGDTINIKGIEYVRPVKVYDISEEVNEYEWSSFVGGG